MKMTKAQLEKAIFETVENESLAGDLGVRIVANAFVKYAGIEIVPDPEPEPPPKPWRLDLGPEPLTARIRDANNKIIVEVRLVNDGANIPDQVRWLMALVAAYNAAGERKRIRIRIGRDPEVLPHDRGPYVASWDGHGVTACWGSREEALGAIVWRHASDLGLEIVES